MKFHPQPSPAVSLVLCDALISKKYANYHQVKLSFIKSELTSNSVAISLN